MVLRPRVVARVPFRGSSFDPAAEPNNHFLPCENGRGMSPNKPSGSGTAGETEPRPASQVLRDFLSNPKIVELLAADDKHVNYAELEQFCRELDYVDSLCRFTKTMALDTLKALRGALSDKRKRPGRSEWVTMSGADADKWVAELRKCIAVLEK